MRNDTEIRKKYEEIFSPDLQVDVFLEKGMFSTKKKGSEENLAHDISQLVAYFPHIRPLGMDARADSLTRVGAVYNIANSCETVWYSLKCRSEWNSVPPPHLIIWVELKRRAGLGSWHLEGPEWPKAYAQRSV